MSIAILSYGVKDPEKVKTNVADLNNYLDAIPAKPIEFNGICIKNEDGTPKLFKTSLEDFINSELDNVQAQKEQKKKEKKMLTCILVGVPNANQYGLYNIKRPLSTISKQGLQTMVSRIKFKLEQGEVILNTNLEALGITV